MDVDVIAMENIAVPQPHPDFQVLADYLQVSEETSTKKIVIHVCEYSSVFDSKFRQQVEALAYDQAKPPLARWNQPGSSHFVIQHNMFIGATDRPPHYIMQQRHSFTSWNEYMIMTAIGDLEEYKHSQGLVSAFEAQVRDLWIIRFPGGGDHVYLGLTELLIADSVCLKADKRLKVVPPAESESEPNHGYSGHVTKPLPGIPYDFLTFFINQPYNKAAGKFIEGPFPLGEIIDAPDGQVLTPEQICRHPAIKVRIALEQPTNAYRHRVNGLHDLAAEEHTPLSAILIGS
ncbi:hypothetical protein DV735_g5984, partial [Chaetothyriales sp. CBS 134920]